MMAKETLIEQAWEILNQPVKTLDDIDKLSLIAIKLGQLAGEYGELSATEAYKYNKELKDGIRKQLQLGVPYNKAESNVGAEVEPKYGEYRIHKETKDKYMAFCARLDNYIKFLMHKNKINVMAEDASNRF